jgi:hypothetical protein
MTTKIQNAMLADDVFTTANAYTASSLNGGQLAGFRNRIINGSGIVRQRGTGVALTATNNIYGSADRWIVYISGGTTVSGTLNGTTTAQAIGFTSNTAIGTPDGTWTTGQFLAQTRLESANVIDLNGKTITVSCKVYQNTGGSRNFKIQLLKPTSTIDTFTATTSIHTSSALPVANNTCTTISTTYTLGAAEASLGLAVTIYDDTANSVASKSYLVSEFQLEIGSTATEFEQRPYGTELALCQRYYWQIDPTTTAINAYGYRVAAGAVYYGQIKFPVTMRIAPSMSLAGVTWTRSNVTAATESLNTRSADSCDMTLQVTAAGQYQTYCSGGSPFTFSAEL